MESSPQFIGRRASFGAAVAPRDADLTRKGGAALELIHQVADTVAQTENQLQSRLMQALDQLQNEEERGDALAARANQAEFRASEAVKWLKRLHDEVEARLVSRGRVSCNARASMSDELDLQTSSDDLP